MNFFPSIGSIPYQYPTIAPYTVAPYSGFSQATLAPHPSQAHLYNYPASSATYPFNYGLHIPQVLESARVLPQIPTYVVGHHDDRHGFLDSLVRRLAEVEAALMASRAQELEKQSALLAAQQKIKELEANPQNADADRAQYEAILNQLRAEIASLKEQIEKLRAQLEEARKVQPVVALTPMIGAEIKALDDGKGGRDNVLVVHSITPGGPADAAGLAPDDILIAWNGHRLDAKPKFGLLLDSSQCGDEITLEVKRSGRAGTFNVPVVIGGTSIEPGLRKKRSVRSMTSITRKI